MNIERTRRIAIWVAVLGLLLSGCGAGPQLASTPSNVPSPAPIATATAAPQPTATTHGGNHEDASASTPTATAAPQPTATRPAGSFNAVKIESAALAHNLIGESAERVITVYLPPGYDASARRYPVVYYLPGFGDTNMGVSSREIDALINAGNIQDMIIVIVPGKNLVGGSFYVNSPTTGNWEDFVAQEVVGYIDSHYRTTAQSGARGISGHSMGGFGSLDIAMRHPDVFGAVYSLSPGLFDENGLANSQMFSSERDIGNFLDVQKAVLAKPQDQQLQSALNMRDNLTVAYGLAFAPDPQNPPFYFDYPYSKSDGKLVRDDNVWKRWESGFGGIPEEVAQYKDNFLKLKGITVDYGTRDEVTWIPPGCVYFDKQLTAAGIPHEMAVHNGTHRSQLGRRILEHMLPFFSELLVGE